MRNKSPYTQALLIVKAALEANGWTVIRACANQLVFPKTGLSLKVQSLKPHTVVLSRLTGQPRVVKLPSDILGDIPFLTKQLECLSEGDVDLTPLDLAALGVKIKTERRATGGGRVSQKVDISTVDWSKSSEEIAAQMGVSVNYLRMMVAVLRKTGHTIPHKVSPHVKKAAV